MLCTKEHKASTKILVVIMSLQVLISTMHQTNRCLIEKIGLESDAVVVNQCDTNSRQEFNFNGFNILWINSTQRGLSRSRNLALTNAKADLCLLVDDDEELRSGYCKTIRDSFARHPDISLIGFQVQGIESTFKEYSDSETNVGFVRSMRMASVEIAFRRKDLCDNNVTFNENIGAGTRYKMGEENALLFDCLSKGLKIYYIPIEIGQVHIGESTWFEGFNKDYFHARGAVFTAMSKRWSPFLILQFAIRKYNRYKGEMGFYNALKEMIKGRDEYLHQIRL